MDIKAVLAHFWRVREKKENEDRAELARMRFLVMAVHCDPQVLLEDMGQMDEAREDFDDEVGDLQRIKAYVRGVRHGH